ncbi:cytochrome c iso-1/iso-2-like [Diadema setosum]|uniref:cytochrome c iso-1/iso-2-like n=1 Tax=Diadema setosum TaxID=31175 RepID=UPI003B3A3611
MPRGDEERGKTIFAEICASCHSIVDSGARRSGPHLMGIWGRQANTLPGYKFAKSEEKSGIIWNDKTLWDYFERGHIPGTKMLFRALKADEQKRADVLAYLKVASSTNKK